MLRLLCPLMLLLEIIGGRKRSGEGEGDVIVTCVDDTRRLELNESEETLRV